MTGKIVSGSENQNQEAVQAQEAKKASDLAVSTPSNHQAPKKPVNVLVFAMIFIVLSNFFPTNRISDGGKFFTYFKHKIDPSMHYHQMAVSHIRKFCLVNFSVNDKPTGIYLIAKIIACSFLKDSFMAAFFPEMKTTMKKNVLNKVQHTFEPNWWGEEADFEEDNEMKSAVKTVGVVGSSITHRAVNTVDGITNFIQITARRFIFFISYKIRAIVCGVSSILLLKLYVVQFFCRLIRVIYLMIRKVTVFLASAVNTMALLTVEVIQEAGVDVDPNAPKLSRSLAHDDHNDSGHVGIKPSKGPPSKTQLPKPTSSLASSLTARPSFIEKMSVYEDEKISTKTSFENLLSQKSFRDWASKS